VENLFSNELENIEEMIKFLHIYDPSLNQENINTLNRSIMSNEIELVIKNLSTKKSPGTCRYTSKPYQTFMEELTSMHLNLFHKTKWEETTKLIL
jgi:hypothetical protein